jgi:hypothetical protein
LKKIQDKFAATDVEDPASNAVWATTFVILPTEREKVVGDDPL